MALLLSVGTFALADNTKTLGSTVALALNAIPEKAGQISQAISDMPKSVYGGVREVTDFYSSELNSAYVKTGTKLFSTSFGFLESTLNQFALFGKNPQNIF